MRNELGKTIAKAHLPQKICASCLRPFTWRKKWERTWNERETCSDRCLSAARALRRSGDGSSGAAAPPADAHTGAGGYR